MNKDDIIAAAPRMSLHEWGSAKAAIKLQEKLDVLHREIEAVVDEFCDFVKGGDYFDPARPAMRMVDMRGAIPFIVRLRALLPREETLAEVAEELVAWWDNESKPLPPNLCDRLRAALARERERGRG